eukprot:gb/GECH01004512.1/.p1 GENE.gb/GECH01004512.1/~~gb/GECH01004512.1/.p1  ORF type:complete len:237 (+),score=67.42 gb/GECH01004512.1/:1-711(+)
MVLDKAFSSGQNINGFQRCGSEPSSPCEKTKIDSSLPFHFKSPSAKHCNYNQPQRPKCNSLNSSNCSTNKTFISAHELAAEMEKSPLELLILDCRSQIRYDLAHIATSINVDVNELVSPNSYEPINCNNNNKNNVQKCNSNYYDDNEENSGDMNNNNNNNINEDVQQKNENQDSKHNESHDSKLNSPGETRFLALDKCLPFRDFLQVLEINGDTNKHQKLVIPTLSTTPTTTTEST